jgi:glycosyltransferase involved in cell wall biosynthesis
MILFLTNAYPDFPDSHRGHFIKRLAHDVSKAGFPVTVVTPKVFYRSNAFEKETAGVDVFRFKYPSGDRQLLHFEKVPYIRMAFYFLSGFMTTMRLAASRRCRLIHAHWVLPTGFLGVLCGFLLRIPVIVHARGTDMHTYAARNRLLRGITLWTLRNASALIATSTEIKGIMTEAFGVATTRIDMVPTGIDTQLFSPETEGRRESGRQTQKGPHIVYVGALSRAKGVQYLLEAVESLYGKYPGLQLTLVGDGPLREKIVHWRGKRGISGNVNLTGALSHDEIPGILRQADVFVLPSLKEGTPNALLEAMASGVACIATRVGEIPEIIEDGEDGLLVTPGSSEVLAATLEALLANRRLRQKLSENCRKKARSYDRNASLSRILNIYGEVMKTA